MTTLITARNDFAKLHAANVSVGTITPPSATNTAPSGNGIFSANYSGSSSAYNGVALSFYGTRTAADDEIFTARVTGWRKISNLWIPVPLLALALTQGTHVGVASGDVLNTEYFADTVTASTAFTSAYELISPTGNQIACVKVDFFGCQFLQVQLAKGTNATCNVLAAGF